ncbi:MAG: serine protease [Candidatus Moranbacteria bacterium]|nr:serine protease [Candidatus Moranbacteria bacterium]
MDKIEICKKLEFTTQKILLFSGNELVSTGTGVVVRNDGVVLTANHVISDFDKIVNPKIVIIGKDEKSEVMHREYVPVLFNVSFDVNMSDSISPLDIDLAILKPKDKFSVGDNFIPLCDDIAPVGMEVLMAGFPDEVKLPFVDAMFNSGKPEMEKNKRELARGIDLFMALRMIKSGMVGATHKIMLNGNFNSIPVKITGASYWIDNASTYGASGGALVNSSGELIGILCQKAMTKFIYPNSNISHIPSGSTMALSHKLITWGMYLCD